MTEPMTDERMTEILEMAAKACCVSSPDRSDEHSEPPVGYPPDVTCHPDNSDRHHLREPPSLLVQPAFGLDQANIKRSVLELYPPR